MKLIGKMKKINSPQGTDHRTKCSECPRIAPFINRDDTGGAILCLTTWPSAFQEIWYFSLCSLNDGSTPYLIPGITTNAFTSEDWLQLRSTAEQTEGHLEAEEGSTSTPGTALVSISHEYICRPFIQRCVGLHDFVVMAESRTGAGKSTREAWNIEWCWKVRKGLKNVRKHFSRNRSQVVRLS